MSDTERAGIAILRIGLGLFLLLWSVDKIVVPEATAGIFDHFYHLSIPVGLAPAIGGAEAILSLAIIAGLWKTVTYGVGLALHAISTLSTIPRLLDPFGDNHLFIAGIPVLAAFVALFLLRERDTLWTVG